MTTENPAVRSQLAEIVELAPSFMVVIRGPALIIETANEAYRRLTGHRELIGLPLRQAFPEVEGQGFFELIEGVYATGEPGVASGIPVMLQRQPGVPPEERYLDLVFQAIVFSAFIYHTWSWFRIMPKTLPYLALGGRRVTPAVITATGLAMAIVASVALVVTVSRYAQ